MASDSEAKQGPPGPLGHGTSAFGSAHPGENPAHIVGASQRSGSPRPLSGDMAPSDDAQTRPLRDASLPRLPDEAGVVQPPIARSSQHANSMPRPSLFRHGTVARQSELDWIIPTVEPKPPRPRTLQERIHPTLEHAKLERTKYELKARMTGYALNIAIGLQVILGALTTGLSAVTTGRQTSIMTAILGGLSTVVASYLARARGSNEPELSIARSKDLDQYIRECEVFVLDFGHLTGSEHDQKLDALRERFEELLGNANSERRLSSV
ncbi:hypothetical protein B0H15DRAFT_844935 [Mycena belliarum]|uniref:SMODS and SLOG-associating 2TM effector domain-containing protein n=1 Tax=Mycena belliarum TaxID=1033014 RepID=A0AAD6U6M7_9AGAR|nr:hypothetical protein B0H15DRAFT_844935 [Mycena belliae]